MNDIMFPTDNDWGIPLLQDTLQVEHITLPVTKWGTARRTAIMQGIYHFYTDDYKFMGLWSRPDALLASQCTGIIEPNFSTHEQMPLAVALYRIYQKRWIARLCQESHIPVLVDMCVERSFCDINMLGVPDGWRAYANRGYSDSRMEDLVEDYERACDKRGGNDVLYLVYGGGKKVRELCTLYGWVWVPENSDTTRGRFVDETTRSRQEAAQAIRTALEQQTHTPRELAAIHGVSESTISDIKRGKTWQIADKDMHA